MSDGLVLGALAGELAAVAALPVAEEAALGFDPGREVVGHGGATVGQRGAEGVGRLPRERHRAGPLADGRAGQASVVPGHGRQFRRPTPAAGGRPPSGRHRARTVMDLRPPCGVAPVQRPGELVPSVTSEPGMSEQC